MTGNGDFHGACVPSAGLSQAPVAGVSSRGASGAHASANMEDLTEEAAAIWAASPMATPHTNPLLRHILEGCLSTTSSEQLCGVQGGGAHRQARWGGAGRRVVEGDDSSNFLFNDAWETSEECARRDK